ncbi:hypothetical protein Y1Q_0017623 [Alligator mississippiensis]|uniref:Uncharacterized protein n=1 Tax=Alligator mississippiensis TaxID=8496 RepID=A0A151P3M2_ALLMI|nr:hypothetical protein Y1Q_0017623 [Alligator mississippiensis]
MHHKKGSLASQSLALASSQALSGQFGTSPAPGGPQDPRYLKSHEDRQLPTDSASEKEHQGKRDSSLDPPLRALRCPGILVVWLRCLLKGT